MARIYLILESPNKQRKPKRQGAILKPLLKHLKGNTVQAKEEQAAGEAEIARSNPVPFINVKPLG